MKRESNLTFVAKRVTYGSANDERAFFEWLERIDGVDAFDGVGSDLYVYVRKNIDEYGLRDLVAIFFRYKVDLTQIPKSVSVEDHSWLLNKEAYWFLLMFPEM